MLDLDPRVHFHEVEALRCGIENALDRAGASIVHVLAQADRRLADLRAQRRAQYRRRTLLDKLLIPTLRGTVPLAQMQDIVPIAQHLDLDVPDIGQEFFQIHGAIAERNGGFAQASRNAFSIIDGSLTTRIPRPPPPADAFNSTG